MTIYILLPYQRYVMLQWRNIDADKAVAHSTVKREDPITPHHSSRKLKKQPPPRPPGVSMDGGTQKKRKTIDVSHNVKKVKNKKIWLTL